MSARRLHELLGLGPLHVAVAERRLDRIDELARQTDIDARNADGHTPLMLAVRHRYAEGVAALLSCGADPNIPDRGGRTPFQEAARQHDLDVADLLAQFGAARLHEVEHGRCRHCGIPDGRTADVPECRPGSLEALRIQLTDFPASCRMSVEPREALRRGVPFGTREHSRILHLILDGARPEGECWEIHLSPAQDPDHRYYGIWSRARRAPLDETTVSKLLEDPAPSKGAYRDTILDIEAFPLVRVPLEVLLSLLSRVSVPLRPPDPPHGAERETVELWFGDCRRSVRIQWWHRGPAAWHGLTGVTGDLHTFLTQSRDEHRARRSS